MKTILCRLTKVSLYMIYSLWILFSAYPSYSHQSNHQTYTFSSETQKKITTIIKVWGFLKYYHPNMCCNTKWDERLVEVLQRLETAQANTNLNTEIEYLLRAAADTTAKPQQFYKSIDREVSGGTHATVGLNFSWMQSLLGTPEIHQQLYTLLHLKQPFDNYYLRLENNTLSRSPILINERSESDSLPNVYQRVLSLARLWNFVQYYYPYKYLLDDDWDSVLVEFLPHYIAAATEKEYIATILRLRTRLHDTHTVVTFRRSLSFFGMYFLPISLLYIEGKVVAGQSNEHLGIQRGDIILSIGGERSDSLIQRLRQYLGASNEATQDHIIVNSLLRYTESSAVTLELLVDNSAQQHMKQVLVPCVPFASYKSTPFLPKVQCRVLDSIPKLYYIDLTQITLQHVQSILDTMIHYQGVVFDLRGYPNGVLYELMRQLVDVTPFAFFRVPNYRMPGYAAEFFTSCGLKRRYMGKVVVLVNEQTISHAEFTAMALQTIPGMKTVGSQTAGTDGDVRKMGLPGGVTIMITGAGVYYPDKTPTQRKGVRIDVEVRPTIAGIRAGRDEVLEKGVEVLRELLKKEKK